jgi:hypothetical protein
MGCTQKNCDNSQRNSLAQRLALLVLSLVLLVPVASAATVTFEVRNPAGTTILSAPASTYLLNTNYCSNQGPTNQCPDSTSVTAQLTTYARTCAPLGTYQARATFSGLSGETPGTGGSMTSNWQNIYTSVCASPLATNDTMQNYCFGGNVWRAVQGCDVTTCGWTGTTPGDANDYIVSICGSGCDPTSNSCVGSSTPTGPGPAILLVSPANGSFISPGTTLDFTITAPGLVSTALYSLDGGANVSFPSPYDIDTTAWALGVHTVSVFANNTAGNSTYLTFVFTAADLLPPTILYTYFTPANSSTVTVNNFLIDVVTSEASVAGVVQLNGVNYSMTLVSSTHFLYNATSLAAGNYTYIAFVNDTANNTGSAGLRIVTVDFIAPTLTFIAPTPADGAFLYQDGAVFNVTASENLTSATLQLDGSNFSMAGADQNWSLTSTFLAAGLHFYQAFGTDVNGLVNGTAIRNLTIAARSWLNTSYVNFSYYPSNYTNTVLEVFNSNVTGSNLTNSTVNNSVVTSSNLTNSTVYNGVTLVSSVLTNCIVNTSGSSLTGVVCSGSWIDPSVIVSSLTVNGTTVLESNVTTSVLNDTYAFNSTIIGSYLFNSSVENSTLVNASVIDSTLVGVNATNSNLTNATLTSVLVINSSLADITLVNATVIDGVIYYSNLSISGYVSYANGTAAPGANVSISGTGSAAGLSTLTDAAGAYSFPSIANGTYSLTATDGAGTGSISTPSAPFAPGASYTINLTLTDTGLPVVVSVSASPNPVNASATGILVAANVTDNGGVVTANATIGATLWTLAYNSATGLWENASVTAPSVTGSYAVNVTASDVSSNTAFNDSYLLAVGDSLSPTVWTVFVTPNPQNNSFPITILANVTDNDGIASVTAVIGGTPWVLAYNGTLWVNSTALAPSAAGAYVVNVTGTDTTGNSGANLSYTLTVTDNVTPAIVSIGASPSPAGLGVNVTVTANATDNTAVTSAYVEFAGSTSPMAYFPTTGLWTAYVTAPSAAASYLVTVSVYDGAGNGANGSISLTVTDTPPVSSSYAINTTFAGFPAVASASWTDDLALSGYLFSHNASGAFVNDSFVSFTGTANTSTGSLTLPPATGTAVGWLFYANDSIGQVSATPVQVTVTTSLSDSSNLTDSWWNGTFYPLATLPANVLLASSVLWNATANDSLSTIFNSTVNLSTVVSSNVTNFSTVLGPGTFIVSSSVNNCTLVTVNLTGVTCFATLIDPSNVTDSTVSGGSSVLESNVSYSQVVSGSYLYFANVAGSAINASTVNFSNVSNSYLYNSHALNSSVANASLVNAWILFSAYAGGSATDSRVTDNSNLTLSNLSAGTNVSNSTLWNSTASNSTVNNSVIANSTLINATVVNSTITNSTLFNATLVLGNLTNNTLYNGTLTFFNTSCNCTSTYNASAGGPVNLSNLTNYPPVLLSASSSTLSTTTGASITFTATASDPNIPGLLGDSLTFAWSFGNGATTVGGSSVAYAYPGTGTFTPSVLVTDAFGATSGPLSLAPITISSPPAPPSGGGGGGGGGGSSGAPSGGGGSFIPAGFVSAPIPVPQGGSSAAPIASPTPTPVPQPQSASTSGLQRLRLAGEDVNLVVTRTLAIRPNPSSPTGWTSTMTLLLLNNGTSRLEDFLVKETIPNEFATDPTEVTFNLKPLYFERGSIITVWKVGFLNPRDTLVLEYSTHKRLLPSYLGLWRPPVIETTRTAPAPTASPIAFASPSPSPAPGALTGLFTAAASPLGLAVLALVLMGVILLVFTRQRPPPGEGAPAAAPSEPASPEAAPEAAAELSEAETRKVRQREARARRLEGRAQELEEELRKIREKLSSQQQPPEGEQPQ